MYGFTLKLTKQRIFIALSAVLIPIIVFSAVYLNKTANKKEETLIADTTQKRVAFLKSHGFDSTEKSETEKTITIPSEFDNVYTAYNNIQKAMGFDLEEFKGQKVKLYTLKINNYPKDSENVYATILIKDKKIIGGDIHSTELNGFMHGFDI